MSNSISLIAILSLFTLLPFIIASGTCFIKFSIVFVIVRNALGLQQVPSNMTLNGVALLLSMFVMMPVGKEIYNNSQNENLSFNNVASVVNFVDHIQLPLPLASTLLERITFYAKKNRDELDKISCKWCCD
ncbi:hypothetical protein AT495_002158 [Escherichia coli]|nr:hypothetical protein [Escherichia coli]